MELGDAWYGATQYHFEVVKRQAARYLRGAGCEKGAQANEPTRRHQPNDLSRPYPMSRPDLKENPTSGKYWSFNAKMGALTDAEGTRLDPKTDLFEQVGDEVHFTGTRRGLCRKACNGTSRPVLTQFNFRVSMGDMPTEVVERTIRLLGEEVAPQFR